MRANAVFPEICYVMSFIIEAKATEDLLVRNSGPKDVKIVSMFGTGREEHFMLALEMAVLKSHSNL